MSARGTAGANQYSTRTKPEDRREVKDGWKERVQIGVLMTQLNEMATGRKRPIPARIKAIEVALDRLLPRLQATELTQVDELDTLTRDEILERIQALLASDPTLLPELIALDARTKATQRSTDSVGEQAA